MHKVITVLHSKLVSNKVTEGENIKNLQSVYLHTLKMTRVNYMSLALLSKREKIHKLITTKEGGVSKKKL